MNDDQAKFFDYIYPSISRRLDELEKKDIMNSHKILELTMAREKDLEYFNQYKKKIQRIEQFLIENGLIKLLEK